MSFMYVIHQPWPAWSAESVPINLLSDALGPFEARHRHCVMSELVQNRAPSTLPSLPCYEIMCVSSLVKITIATLSWVLWLPLADLSWTGNRHLHPWFSDEVSRGALFSSLDSFSAIGIETTAMGATKKLQDLPGLAGTDSDEDLDVLQEIKSSIAPQVSEDEDDTCEQCGKLLSDCGEKSKWPKFGMKILGKPCFNALHSIERQLDPEPEVKRKFLELRTKNPIKFDAVVAALRTKKKFSRQRVALKEQLHLVSILCEEDSKSRNTRFLLFTRRQWCAWHKIHVGLERKKALKKWTAAKLNVKIHKEISKVSGKLLIACEMPPWIVFSKTRKEVTTGSLEYDDPDGQKTKNVRANLKRKMSKPFPESDVEDDGPPPKKRGP